MTVSYQWGRSLRNDNYVVLLRTGPSELSVRRVSPDRLVQRAPFEVSYVTEEHKIEMYMTTVLGRCRIIPINYPQMTKMTNN